MVDFIKENETYFTTIDGKIATKEDLLPLAFAGFAHFTALQIRNKKIKGLRYHIDRLANASNILFGVELDQIHLLKCIKDMVDQSSKDISLIVSVFSPHGEFNTKGMGHQPKIMVKSAPPCDGPIGSLRLGVVNYERPMPEIKHVGEIGKTYFLQQAVRLGFDDMAFMDNNGHLSEATIWNLAFWDGQSVVWPRARLLIGTTMSIVQSQLRDMGIKQRYQKITLESLKEFHSCVIMNSWNPAVPVSAIDNQQFTISEELTCLLKKAFEKEAWQIL